MKGSCSVIEFIFYTYFFIYIINLIHKFHIFNLLNGSCFHKVIYLNFFKYYVKPFLSNRHVWIIFFKKIHILNQIHEFCIFNLPNRLSFQKQFCLNLFNYDLHFEQFSSIHCVSINWFLWMWHGTCKHVNKCK